MAKFKFIKDYDADYLIKLASATSNGQRGLKSFKVGNVIEGGSSPYSGENIAAPNSISTTLEGKMPNWEASGQLWLSIPLNVLEEVSADTPTTNDKKPLTNTQKWMWVIGITAVAYYLLYKVNKNN
jgi:hypothetical protein